MKLKLGQKIVFKKEHIVKTLDGKEYTVKSGDVARVMKKVDETHAQIIYLSGEAKNISREIEAEVESPEKSLNPDTIAKQILDLIHQEKE